MSEQDVLEAIIAIAPGIENSNMAFSRTLLPVVLKSPSDDSFPATLSIVSSAVWFFWDWAISIDAEVQLFWGKKLNTGSILYFANRLLAVVTLLLHFQTSVRPLTSTLSSEMCKPVVFCLLVLNGISGFVVQTVLVLRTYALWDCNNFVFWFLMALNASASIAQQGLIMNLWGKNILTVVWNPLPAPYTGCLVQFNIGTWERYVPILVFEFGVVFFLLVKFIAYMRQGRSNRVLYVLFRDGFIEFSAVSACSILSLLIGIFSSGDSDNLDLITFDLVSSISVICCARMLLNIRDVMTLSDPRDTTKPNPWSLDDSFDERYGSDGHTITAPPEESRMDMFESFFRNSEQVPNTAHMADEQIDVVLPISSDHVPPEDSTDAKGKRVLREPGGVAPQSYRGPEGLDEWIELEARSEIV
ncbi:hypothetical protein DL93DRAFT_2230697 [Clavulina sp. PMI_390]|nr:hypothetical protein DL93DRAFT_2230697 [Clavulina sp. PMI_390]